MATVPQITPQPGPQTQFAATSADIALFGGSAGGGKALSIDTLIPTNIGWTTMGQVSIGDCVFDCNGEPTLVVRDTRIMHGHKCYEVQFSDGTVIVADEDHLWVTMTANERAQAQRRTEKARAKRRATRKKRGTGKKPWLAKLNAEREHEYLEPPIGQVRSTAEIAKTLYYRKQANHSVDVADTLSSYYLDADDTEELPIAPYVLGMWLGDGTGITGAITTEELQIVDEIRREGYEIHRIPSSSNQYRIRGLTTLLRYNNLRANKHIPRAYLRASPALRQHYFELYYLNSSKPLSNG